MVKKKEKLKVHKKENEQARDMMNNEIKKKGKNKNKNKNKRWEINIKLRW